MKILNFGSINLDNVYSVEHFVKPGETIQADSFAMFRGGKGLNQSIALARAGAEVFHAGRVGADGGDVLDFMAEEGINTSLVTVDPAAATGKAVIQVDPAGENCIIIYGGANQKIDSEQARDAMEDMESGDILLLQNEISSTADIMRTAHEKGMRIFINPAPMNAKVTQYPLELVDTFIVNETEAAGLSGMDPEDAPETIIRALKTKYENANILMTLGAKGSMYMDAGGKLIAVPAVDMGKPVDTTAAGDTFIGYFLASLSDGMDVESSMKRASTASGITVSRKGASDSIPRAGEFQL